MLWNYHDHHIHTFLAKIDPHHFPRHPSQILSSLSFIQDFFLGLGSEGKRGSDMKRSKDEEKGVTKWQRFSTYYYLFYPILPGWRTVKRKKKKLALLVLLSGAHKELCKRKWHLTVVVKASHNITTALNSIPMTPHRRCLETGGSQHRACLQMARPGSN